MRVLELTRSGVLATVVVFLIAAVCVRLGIWQLDRRGQRLDRNAAVAERLAQPSVALRSIPRDTVGMTDRWATVSGEFDNDRAVILAGRSRNGTPGVHVLTPLRIAGGAGALLVNRGWVPSRDAATVDLSALAVDTAVTVTGRMVGFPDVDVDVETDGFRTTWFRVDGDGIRGQYPYDVAALYLVRSPEEGPAAAGPIPLDPPTLDGGPHLSYALQWFSFAAIALVGWAALAIRSGGGRSGGGTTRGS